MLDEKTNISWLSHQTSCLMGIFQVKLDQPLHPGALGFYSSACSGSLYGLTAQAFYGLDVLSVTQPTVLRH